MKSMVVYYSKSGNNAYLAHRFAEALQADTEELKPRLNVLPLQIIFSLVSAGAGFKQLQRDVRGYDTIVLCGPIWMGKLVYPLRAFIGKYNKDIKNLYFATCCGGGDEQKDDRFGYAGVLARVRELLGERCRECGAFPIVLCLPEEQRKDGEAVMKRRLSDKTFDGPFKERFNAFAAKIRKQA